MHPPFRFVGLRRTLRCLPWVVAGLPGLAFAQFVDTFDTIDPAWVVDRYAPAGFQSVSFLGDNRLQITIDQTGSALNRPAPTYAASFFNTQGEARPGDILGDWTLSAEVYVSSAFDTTSGQLVQSDLMAHTGTTSTDGDYATIGFTNASPTDPLNPAAPDRSFAFQVFDSNTANWIVLSLPAGFTFDAWYTLSIIATGTDFQYATDGNPVLTEPTISGDNLQTAFIESYNFGQTDAGGQNSYSVYWDNAIATVPEPADFALATGLATLALVWAQSRGLRKPR
jgi:hypothetical protein